MTSQISAPVRIVALVGVLAALALGGWIFMQGQSGGSAGPTQLTATPSSAISQANAVAGKLNTHNLATAAGKPNPVAPAAAGAKPKAVVVAKPKAVVVVKPKTAVAVAVKPKAVAVVVKPAVKAKPALVKHVAKLPNGTPNTIASLLATHAVVVVLLYNPRSKVDYYSLSEAELGASQASAGFLSVNVLSQRQAAPFTRAYGVLQDPTVLFFVHPGRLVQQLIGFADHETVSQAATNEAVKSGWVQTRVQRKTSAAAGSTDAALAAWRTKANAVCNSKQASTLPPTTSDALGAAYVRGIERQINYVVVGLSALPLPAATHARALVNSYIGSLKKLRRDYESFLRARLKNDRVTANARFVVLTQDDAKARALKSQLGLTECG